MREYGEILKEIFNNMDEEKAIKYISDRDCPRSHGLKDHCGENRTCVDCWKQALEEKYENE